MSDAVKLAIVTKPSTFAGVAIAASATAHFTAGSRLAVCNDVGIAPGIKRLHMAAQVIVTVSALTVSARAFVLSFHAFW